MPRARPAGGRPAARARAASASVSSSNMTNTARPPGPCVGDEAEDLGVPEQVVADVLDRLELRGRPVLRHEHVRVAALERVEVGHVVEVPHPAVDAEQVERGGGDEVDRGLVGAEELPQVGDPAEHRWRAAHACLPVLIPASVDYPARRRHAGRSARPSVEHPAPGVAAPPTASTLRACTAWIRPPSR